MVEGTVEVGEEETAEVVGIKGMVERATKKFPSLLMLLFSEYMNFTSSPSYKVYIVLIKSSESPKKSLTKTD